MGEGFVTYRETVVPAARRASWAAGGAWLLVLAAAMTLYTLTMAPNLVWLDAGYYQWEAARLNLVRPGEAVRVHPLFLFIAHGLGSTGLWDYARAASVASALGTAITVANVWLIVWLLVRRTGAATVAALACMLAHTVWQLGAQPQTYGWSNAALTGMLVLAIAYAQTSRTAWLLLAALVGGLGLSVHLMSQFGLAVLAVWVVVRVVRRETPWGVIPAGLGLWLVGGALFWYVAIMEYQRTGDVRATLESAFLGGWGGAVFNLRGIPQMLGRSVLMLVMNFPTPVALLGLWGAWRSRRLLEGTPMAALLGATAVLYVLFAVRYRIPNQNHFFTPVYVLMAVYIGLGVAAVEWSKRAASTVLLVAATAVVVPAYWAMAETARSLEFNLRSEGEMHRIPYRDVYAYYLLPWQHTQAGARRFAEEVLAAVPRRAVLLPDTTTAPPLKCLHDVEGVRPDVLIVDPYDAQFDESLRPYWRAEKSLLPQMSVLGRRVFVTSDQPAYVPAWVRKHGQLEPLGLAFEVLPRPEAPPKAAPEASLETAPSAEPKPDTDAPADESEPAGKEPAAAPDGQEPPAAGEAAPDAGPEAAP